MALPASDTRTAPICRSATGALDLPCYERHAHRLRTQAMQQWLRTLSHWLLHGWRCLRAGARNIATRRALASLDPRTLKDIGLASADLPAVADGSFLADTTRRQRAVPPPVCWMNGALVALDQARVSVFDHGLLYGDGVFEGIRFYHGRAFRIDAHLDRLFCSAAALRLDVPYSRAALAVAARETIAAFGAANGYLRLVVTRGEGKLGLDPASCARGNCFMLADHLALVSEATRDNGARLIVAATRRLAPDGLDPRIKSLNYLNHILARMEASNAGADEAIMLNAQGRIAEGTADNVFIVRNGTLLTPPAADGALEGVTRAVVLELAARLDIPAREASLTPYDLYTADEVFLSGTGAELIPVRDIDGRRPAACPGPMYKQFLQSFHAQIARESMHTA